MTYSQGEVLCMGTDICPLYHYKVLVL